MAAPGTNKQIPDHAILDHFNKQVYLGNQFSLNSDVISISGSSEVNFLYIANPALSALAFPNGPSVFINSIVFSCVDPALLTDIVYRVYFNPTAVSGGTALTPRNCRPASTNTTVATAKKSPTATKTTLIATFLAGSDKPFMSNFMYALDPGQSLLITAQPSASTSGICLMSWYEI